VQALEKIVTNTDWITIVLVVLLSIVFLLKFLNPEKLKTFAFALFNKGFIEKETEEGITFFKPFYSIIFLFSISVFALVCSTILVGLPENKNSYFYLFIGSFGAIFIYLLLKWFLEYLLSLVFLIRKDTRFFLISKSSYLYNISFYLFICLIIVQFTELNTNFLLIVTVLFFIIRFCFHLANNKKLIINELFYFILYLCTLEIAPLFLVFKLMF
jgi:hypothetical protein